MRFTRSICAAAFAFVSCAAFGTQPAEASAAASSCTTVGEAVAMQVDGLEPIVAGRDGAIARFSRTGANDRAQMTSSPPDLVCTAVRGVVGLAIDSEGRRYVADDRRVHVIARNGDELWSFSPSLSRDATIEAIALLPTGQVELALARNASSGDLFTSFAVFSSGARGDDLVPMRRFAISKLLGRVDAIAIDSEGDTYAYDDGGEIVVFRSGATGPAIPARRLSGTRNGLVPLPATGERRQLAFDEFGFLYATAGMRVLRFHSWATDGMGEESMASAGSGDFVGVATSNDGRVFMLRVSPHTRAASIDAGFEPGGEPTDTRAVP